MTSIFKTDDFELYKTDHLFLFFINANHIIRKYFSNHSAAVTLNRDFPVLLFLTIEQVR